jgi:type I restriction enzyme M protein
MTTISSQSSLDSKIKSICDIMRRSNAAGALQYVPELSWILFLRILDEREELEQTESQIVGASFTPSLSYPYRWQDWAAPTGNKRQELQNAMAGDVFNFVNEDLLPYLRNLKEQPNATSRQRVVSEVVAGVERIRLDTERNFLDVIDKVDEIRQEGIDPTHIFTLSQAYEGLLLSMGEKNNDGGQFFTPREVIRTLVKAIDPQVGETVYDPACGTGGFLAQSYDHMKEGLGQSATAEQMTILANRTFYGREKENLIYPISLANLILHGIDEPHIWHGNTLTRNEEYGGLFAGAPDLFDVVLMNPPFGGKEGQDAQTRYPYKTGSTQVLFLQEIIDSLTNTGRAGIVVDEGLLFRTNENAFVQSKRRLLDECDLWCIVSLPGGVFTQAGAGVKTNLLFFTKGKTTENIWYYDLSDVKVTKRKPITAAHFDEFFKLLPGREESENSWTVTRQEIEEKNYDLKAVNPNRKEVVDTRTPDELLDIIEAKGKEIQEALAMLREL